jgi:glycosyltransferase involved in cell wall biosynthesis
MITEKTPLVSVRLMTYNHVPFIKDAMKGILMQKTNFPVEVVIGDDFSTDGTLDIIRTYKDTENIKINILERTSGDNYWKNRLEKGRLYNFVNIIENCEGKYIALLDGDDYWTDPHKLQKQVDLLESDIELNIIYHNVKPSGIKARPLNHKLKQSGYFNFHDSLQRKNGATLSMVFRNNAIQNINIWEYLNELTIADWPIECLCLLKGKGYYIHEIMGCYRMEGIGVSNNLTRKTYLDVRHKVAERLLAMNISKYNKVILQSFLNRILFLRLYYHFVNGKWASLSTDLHNLINTISWAKTPKAVIWEKQFATSSIIRLIPIMFILGIKNKLFSGRKKVDKLI